MKRIFTLLLGLLGLACSANAQEIPLELTGGWGWTKNNVMSGEVTVTSSNQWAEFKLSSIPIQLSVYKGVKITFSNNTGNWQIRSVNASDQGEYLAFIGSDGVFEHTFNTGSYGDDPEITTFELQHADNVEASITIEKVELISTDDKIFIPNYAEGWGCSYQLKSDNAYSGQFTTSSQWAEIGGSNWKQEYTAGQQHTFTLKLNSGAPDGLQLKVQTPAGDKYPAIAAGTTEFSYDLKEEYTSVSIQNTKSSAVTLDIASMTVTITEAIPPSTYKLGITASGKGSASYSGTTIRGETTTFTFNEGASATIIFTPDTGYRIANVKVNNTDVTANVRNNQITISSISANTMVSVTFEAVPSSTIGTESNPYTVSQAHALIQSLGADVESEEIYVKGFISQIDNISPYPETAYGNATYWISDVKGSTAGQLEVWRGYSIGGEKFSSKDEIKYGDEVIVKGKVVNYRGTNPEFTSGSIIYSLNGQTATEKPVPEFFGTLDEPITVSKAVELINALEDGGSTEKEAYVKGKITAIKTTDENIALYKNIDYIISDGTRELTVFRGKNLNNTDFSEAGQINVGDEVVVLGKLTKYVNNGNVIPEVAQGNYIVKFTYKSEGSACQLTISISGSGSVIFNGTTIRDKATSFTVNEGSSVTITFTPDTGCRIASVQMGNTYVTSSIRNNTFTISNITSNTTMSVVFEEREKAISLGDKNYTVTSYENHTLSLARGAYGQVLTVPATVDYENETFTVTGINDDALTDATGLAAIIWNPKAAFTGQVSNPNLLLYVNAAEYAPSSIKNVVVNGTAASITLTDTAEGNDFYCPEEFTAQLISYAHRYDMITGLQESGGWETIALPFNVEQITHSSKGTLVPFLSWNSNGVTKPFWLYEYGAGGFRQASAIRANTPYIISMPNNDKYLAEYKVNGTVTFSAENVKVLKTEDVHPAVNGSFTFVPNFMRRESSDGCYALNVKNDYVTNSTVAADGSMFVRNSRAVLPFEAYMTAQAANAREFIPVFEDVPTGIREVELLNDNVHGSWFNDQRDAWYTLEGLKLSGKPKKKGVYIYNGKAVVR